MGATAGALPALQQAQNAAQRAQRLQQAGELALRAVELRQQAGAESPLAVLEAHQQMVVLTDDLAVAQGRLALAWAELLPLAAPYLAPRASAAATP
jgi:type II secretory pathway pseudopilin PulG